MGRMQTGSVYEAAGSFYARYRDDHIVDGQTQRVQRSVLLRADRDGLYKKDGAPCTTENEKYSIRKIRGKKTLSRALKMVLASFMQSVNSGQTNSRTRTPEQDIRVVDFWETSYLPYCEREWKGTGMKPSTVRGFKQVWRQHLKNHFSSLTFRPTHPISPDAFFRVSRRHRDPPISTCCSNENLTERGRQTLSSNC